MGRRPFEEWLSEFERTVPPFDGKPITLRFRPRLSAARGRLLSGGQSRGKPVWAGSFIRRRSTVLDSELLEHESALRGILIHELFHFAWVRAGNPVRRSYAALLALEAAASARGEVGESAEVQKHVWRAAAGSGSSDSDRGLRRRAKRGDVLEMGVRAWADYVCESFCDTAAWALCPRAPWPVSLAARWQRRRRVWFREWVGGQAGGVRI